MADCLSINYSETRPLTRVKIARRVEPRTAPTLRISANILTRISGLNTQLLSRLIWPIRVKKHAASKCDHVGLTSGNDRLSLKRSENLTDGDDGQFCGGLYGRCEPRLVGWPNDDLLFTTEPTT